MSSRAATSVACHRSTSRRISTARWRAGRICSAAMKARRIDSRRTASSAGSSVAGKHLDVRGRFDPRGLRQGSQHGGRSGRRRTEIHRPSPALAALQHVEAHVGGDAVQPGTHGGATLEGVRGAPGPQQRVLNGVLCFGHRTEHPVAVARELGPVQGQRSLDLRTAAAVQRRLRTSDHVRHLHPFVDGARRCAAPVTVGA